MSLVLAIAMFAEATFGTRVSNVGGFTLYRAPSGCFLSKVLPSGTQAVFQIANNNRADVKFALMNNSWASLKPGQSITAKVSIDGFKPYDGTFTSSLLLSMPTIATLISYDTASGIFAGKGVVVERGANALGIVPTGSTRPLAQLTECAWGSVDPFAE